MAKRDYDKILRRLIETIAILSRKEKVKPSDLAKEFGVTVRTIQKDLYNRLHWLSIEKDSEGYLKFTDGFSLDKSKLNYDELSFLSLAISQFENTTLFKEESKNILKKILHEQTNTPYCIKYHDMQKLDISPKRKKLLENAIKNKNILKIQFQNHSYSVEPYKLTNYDGFWYLLAKDIKTQRVKNYMISQIDDIKKTFKKYDTSYHDIEEIVKNVHTPWFEDGITYKVLIKVYSNIAHYFQEKKFLQSQKIEKTYKNGDIEVSFVVTHPEDIDNTIKSWLPDIEVLKPSWYKKQIIAELEKYLQRLTKT